MHSDWAIYGVNILDEQVNIVDAGFAIMPLRANEQVKIKNTWQVSGVSASGSNTVTADQLILPAHLLLSFKNLRSGASADPAFIAALEPLFPLTVLAPMLGAAEGILEFVKDTMPKRKIIGWQYES
jgi:hypothetical protein